MNRSAQPKQMACVSIGYYEYLVPLEAATKIIALMANAVGLEKDLDHASGNYCYTVRAEQPRIEMTIVRPDDLRFPNGSPAQPQPAQRRLAR
ncbi:MAG: hypothetical protein JSR68_08450 [Proteobacteria bacterium]|nr:hypothetical protein [Pseudomonadota bacterium]